ncbi:GNAT family N-acetyltransferase [Noviherbaspirillum galbum]|uniref:GNAT family N-acetyltransferase n=1 Tax=Noviherbaspirillum galbum TaxID=2709383 RepID=UPI002E2B7C0A|nr:GNAT family N-acetyltransferase [Noviherbaspirillum galbum]
MNVEFSAVRQEDAEDLVRLRIAAMRESLERLGRFDPQRARDRFLSTFSPAHTRHVLADGQRVGFVVIRPDGEDLLLDHLYILPAWQGAGIGSLVLRDVFRQADALGKSVRVGALKGSDSNRFYLRHGFVLVREEEWDNYYIKAAGTMA